MNLPTLNWRTVLGNVLLQLELRGLDPKAYEARAIAPVDVSDLALYTDDIDASVERFEKAGAFMNSLPD